jgi:hypothetical protein
MSKKELKSKLKITSDSYHKFIEDNTIPYVSEYGLNIHTMNGHVELLLTRDNIEEYLQLKESAIESQKEYYIFLMSNKNKKDLV